MTFNVGDRIVVTRNSLRDKGRVGTVKKLLPDESYPVVEVLLDGTIGLSRFYTDSVAALVESKNPQVKPFLTENQVALVDAAVALREAQERFDQALRTVQDEGR